MQKLDDDAVTESPKFTPFNLTISRQHRSAVCTSGYLAVNGRVIAYTVELPWRGNAPEISSIPAGSYPAHLRYDHADKWRIELDDVPGRTNVQIHIGNTTADIKGCILVGSSLSPSLCSVSGSAAAYAALKTEFYGSANPTSTPDRTIRVVVEG